MTKISKRFADRAKGSLRRYQKILESARSRDVGESDTALVVSDMLTEILGYDKYEEITTEFAIRGTFCDLAIRVNGQLRFLIEVKSIGTSLRENHLNQATAYGARQGIEWVLLTNGVCWQAYRLRFEQPIQQDLVFSIDLLDPATRSAELIERLYLISKEAGSGGEIDRFYRNKEATSRYVIAQALLSDTTVAVIRRQLRAVFPGAKIEADDLRGIIQGEVLKRDVLEGERSIAASKLLRRSARRRSTAAPTEAMPATPTPSQPRESAESEVPA